MVGLVHDKPVRAAGPRQQVLEEGQEPLEKLGAIPQLHAEHRRALEILVVPLRITMQNW